MLSPNPSSNYSNMKYFEEEIKINIFKCVDYPLNLALTCQNWSVIAKDPYAKTEWLIVHYGKAHALFYAIRLGPTFIINLPTCQALIARKMITSRYFIQRLLMYFGKYEQKLIELKIEHQFDAGRIRTFQQKIKLPWASNFSLLFTCQLFNANKELPPMENDMKLFHFLSLSIDFRAIKYVPGMLRKNLKGIKVMTLNKRLSQFPSRSKSYLSGDSYIHQQPISEEYLPKKNNKLNVIRYLQQESFLRRQHLFSNRPLSVLTPFTINRRRRLRRQRSINRRRCVQFDNQDTLNRISNLPQQFANDSLINQFFNGSSFN